MTGHVHVDERVIDVRQIDPQHRHMVILQLFENLPAHGAIQLIADHDPKPLRFQLEAKSGAACLWAYLEQGPDAWRVRLGKKSVRETSDA